MESLHHFHITEVSMESTTQIHGLEIGQGLGEKGNNLWNGYHLSPRAECNFIGVAKMIAVSMGKEDVIASYLIRLHRSLPVSCKKRIKKEPFFSCINLKACMS